MTGQVADSGSDAQTPLGRNSAHARRPKPKAIRVSGTALYATKTMTEWCIRHLPRGRSVFFPSDSFPWTQELEAQVEPVRGELTRLLGGAARVPGFVEVSPEQAGITRGEEWRTFFFYIYGHRVDDNCRRCPETTRLLNTIPGMKTAFFSILAPGKRIAEHRGPYKGVLRYHLGLLIPSENSAMCGIRVDTETRSWRQGGSLVFDDSFFHEAWNLTDQIRAVLFVDFERPLPWPVRWFNRRVIDFVGRSAFVAGTLARARRIAAALPPEAR